MQSYVRKPWLLRAGGALSVSLVLGACVPAQSYSGRHLGEEKAATITLHVVGDTDVKFQINGEPATSNTLTVRPGEVHVAARIQVDCAAGAARRGECELRFPVSSQRDYSVNLEFVADDECDPLAPAILSASRIDAVGVIASYEPISQVTCLPK